MAFIAKSPVFQFGGLATWQASFAGDKTVLLQISAIQPFYFWQLGKGTYLRRAPTWVFNFKDDSYSIPLGLGINSFKDGENSVQLSVEPHIPCCIESELSHNFRFLWELICSFLINKHLDFSKNLCVNILILKNEH
ncbi:hypothetical protein [Chryseobacterium indoltheticum]|uniref:hypothetical protein n=1 Tax=Chryseobacterium indoltheticum TaxID=254 RepID=UPI00191381B1|nr:hypothetical protein [Chryseobacterium indoltheticum]QQQ26646.1 hypothetical protein JJL46_10945 [Chryseobacterium indoltheticum]